MSEETVSFNLELNVEQAVDNSRKLELILFRGLGLWNRMCRLLGVPDDSPIMVITERAQRLVMIIRSLHTAVVMLQAARMAAGDPIAWAMAGLSIGSATMAVADTMTSIGE